MSNNSPIEEFSRLPEDIQYRLLYEGEYGFLSKSMYESTLPLHIERVCNNHISINEIKNYIMYDTINGNRTIASEYYDKTIIGKGPIIIVKPLFIDQDPIITKNIIGVIEYKYTDNEDTNISLINTPISKIDIRRDDQLYAPDYKK